MWLFIILIVVPIIEIALFVKVGGAIGLWSTLAIVILTAALGSMLLRSQGLATLSKLQNSLRTGTNPLDPIANGALILVAGVVLLTPGFFTDAVGFALLVPPVRALVIKWIAVRIASGRFAVFTNVRSTPETRRPQPQDPGTVDGDFTVIKEEDEEGGESGWTRH